VVRAPVLHTGGQRLSPLPPTTNSAKKCSQKFTTDLLEQFIASRAEEAK
jgi:hypothetical protein